MIKIIKAISLVVLGVAGELSMVLIVLGIYAKDIMSRLSGTFLLLVVTVLVLVYLAIKETRRFEND